MSKKNNVILLFFLVAGTLFAQKKEQNFELAGQQVQLTGEFGDFETETSIEKLSGGLEILTISLTHQKGATPPEFSLKWKLPSSNIAGYWSSAAFNDKTIGPSWAPSSVRSMLAKQAPVITLFGHDDSNRLTFAATEALNTVVLSSGVKEEDGLVYNEITFFSEKHQSVTDYEVKIRFDTRP